jgi:hypothetical protein
MIKYFYTLIAIIVFSITAQAQNGEIQGKVTDANGEALPFAQLIIVNDELGTKLTSKGTKADANGLYTLKGLSPGKYNLLCKVLGKAPNVETEITVYAGRPVTVNFVMKNKNIKGEVIIKTKEKRKLPKLIDVFQPKETVIGAAEIKEGAVRDINSIAGSTGGVVQEDMGASLNIGGGRDNGVLYIVDGVKMTGSSSVPPTSIGQIEVITSGVPAKYGDANAGVISITTKGPSEKFRAGVEGLTSQFLDPYGYNLLGFNASGPIFRKKSTIDSSNPDPKTNVIKGEPILGYFVSAEYQTDGDKFPTINGNWKVKDQKYQDILDNPYRLSTDGSKLLLNQAFLTANDLEKTSAHQNTSGRTIRVNGKLDWKVVPNSTNITVGGRLDNDRYNDFINRYALLNFQNNRIMNKISYNGYVRLYQPLFNSDKQVTKSIRNTTMTLQADYTRTEENYKSPVGGDNPWNYGYIGKFTELTKPNYIRNEGGDGTLVYYAPGEFIKFGDNMLANSFSSTGVNFDKGSINPLAATQTKAFIDMYRDKIAPFTSINAIDNAGGIINGKRASEIVHDLFYPAARIYNGIQKEENDQFRLTGTFNFDIVNKKSTTLNKHTIEAGFELEQRINRKYQISPNTFWTTAQSSLLNAHLSPDNTRNYNPLLIIGNVKMRLQDYKKQLDTAANPILFSPFDSIFYDSEVSNGQQTQFSKNLRQALGYDSLTRLNIHEMDPNKMKLEWFTANDLIQNSFVTSQTGFDVYGNSLSASTNFQDFFTQKDKNGNYTRNVAPYMPRYGAGYIQDRFQLNDIAFNVGFRVDYFDPNTYQLKDPYVPQGGRTITDPDVVKTFKNDIPANLPSDAVVYVDNPTSPSKITGFRSGSKWYDEKGGELLSYKSIETKFGSVNPYLIGNTDEERAKRDMTSSTFDPNLIFTPTKAKFAFAPRINFTFKIDTFVLLFAHYDVLNQRPEQDVTIANALTYYNMLVRKTSATHANPSLDFSSSSDLELGFKTRLSAKSALTINFQYREYTNQLTQARIDGGFPNSYTTWGTTDFSTVKSLGLAYELRRTNNLRLKANYTLQFAEGSGSSRTSQQNIINAGLGNIKVIFPLEFQTQHVFNINTNYRFDDGENYNGPAKLRKLLENFGANIDFSLKSGKPYTQQTNSTPEVFLNSSTRATTLGDINSASMPWRVNVNLKLDKDFQFKLGKKTKGPDGVEIVRREYSLNIYLQIQNLFNSSNVLNVYRYTGDAKTDGYLNSKDGILQYNSNESVAKGYGQGFRDLYNVSLEIPKDDNRISYYARPRIVQLGAVMSF